MVQNQPKRMNIRYAEMHVKFQSDTIFTTSHLSASRLREILQQDVLPLSE